MDKILIVDGYSSIRELAAQELADEGNIVVAVGNPASIPYILDTLEPDLVILDLFMDGKMKWSVLHEIKKQRPRLPLVIFTTSAPDRDLYSLPVEGWVIKSFLFDELKQRVREILGGRFMGGMPSGRITQGVIKESKPGAGAGAPERIPPKTSIH